MYDKALVKVSQVVYIYVTTYQKSFIFGPHVPWRIDIHIMTPESRVPDPRLGWKSKSRTPLKSAILFS